MRIIVLLVVLAFLGCQESIDRPPQADPPDPLSTDITAADYTISIDEDAGETVFIYYSLRNASPIKEERFFSVGEGVCVRLTAEQFNNISIFASRGSFSIPFFGEDEKSLPAKTLILEDDDYMPLCNAQFKCTPNSYVVSSRESGVMDAEQLVMRPVEDVKVFEDQCDYYYSIDKWMEFKVQRYALGSEARKGNADDSLKAQIAEWPVSR